MDCGKKFIAFFAPNNWEIIIVAPAESPLKKLIGSFSKLETESMAASPSLPVNLPTMTASAAAYRC